jgi:predicted alpha/beta hydrolase
MQNSTPGELIPITLQDGSSTEIELFDSGLQSDGPVILIFPAMGMKASYYAGFAEALSLSGYAAITADLKGIGRSSVRPGKEVNFGYKEMIETDLGGVVHWARNRFADRNIILLGHSLGGQLASLYAAKYPANIDALILIACCSVYYKGWGGLAQYRILMGTQFIGALSTAVGYFPGKRVGFGGTNAKGVMQDWSRQSRTGKYVLNNEVFDYETALKSLNLPILSISFEGDNFSPLSAVNHLLSKFSDSAEIKNVYLGKSDPLNQQFNHFNWPKKPDHIVRLISEFV